MQQPDVMFIIKRKTKEEMIEWVRNLNHVIMALGAPEEIYMWEEVKQEICEAWGIDCD